MGAGNQHIFAAECANSARTFVQRRFFVFIVNQATRFDRIRGNDHGVRNQQFAHCADQLVCREFIAASGSQDRIEHQRDIGIIGGDFAIAATLSTLPITPTLNAATGMSSRIMRA